MNKRLSKGFTLVELMVTVVILSIIIGIAYPSYQRYTTQTRRSDAQVALTQTVNRLEKYFSVCSSYPTAGAGLTNDWPGNGGASQCPPDDSTQGLGLDDTDSPERHYSLVLDVTQTVAGACAAAGACYTLTASPKVGGLQVGNGNLRIDSVGRKAWNKPGAGWGSWSRK